MKLANKILEQLKKTDEGSKHFNTKVRALEGVGSRKIRLAVKETKRMVECMLDPSHSAPNPLNSESEKYLEETKVLLKQSMDRLKDVKESKNRKK